MLLDLNMPGGGIESAREISTIYPYVKIAMRNHGIRLCLIKGEGATSLTAALRCVHGADEPMLGALSAPRAPIARHNRRKHRQLTTRTKSHPASTVQQVVIRKSHRI